MKRFVVVAALSVLSLSPRGRADDFKLAPAVALEAEDFHVESGWKVVHNGDGNYMVDVVGFNHISGERLLCVDGKSDDASAFMDFTVPETGKYRLWARYEYPGFCEARFHVVLQQDGKTVLDQGMGAKDGLRYGLGDPVAKAQHDQSWGPEGLYEEGVTTPELKAGKARVYLRSAAQPQEPGRAAGRHIDFVYLTRDLDDAWRKHYVQQTNLYPILDAFRDTRGPRWEARFTNRGDKPADYSIAHVYNRLPWGVSEPVTARGVAPGAASAWVGLGLQDTCHFGLTRFVSSGQPFDVEVRPAGGGEVECKLSGPSPLQVYLPPYPGKGDKPITPVEEIDAVLKELRDAPAPGKKPTKPLCYGGWMPVGLDDAYGRKYAELYAALGFRSLHPALTGPDVLKNLAAVGVPPTKSWDVGGYRNPPTPANIAAAKKELTRTVMQPYLHSFDYGDEIDFSEWVGMMAQEEIDKAAAEGRKVTKEDVLSLRWRDWLKANRPDGKAIDYWPEKWGAFDAAKMRPDSGAAVAATNPKLYVDSLLFYDDVAIRFAADGAKQVRAAFGDDVLTGCNYSNHPLYYPNSSAYIRWFRGGAADLGRHSDFFWEVAQPGPMVNGYVAEYFRCGMRDNPKAVLRQYTMPHSPGNTDASFRRSVYTHLAHGARELDFFGVGMNECFTENHIDHRDHDRYRALRDAIYSVGLVEDLLPESHAVASPVALLVSDSTERWDFAGVATDGAGRSVFGPDFRKIRLNSHIDRLGLWTALTFLGASPDLLVEADVNAKALKDYKVLALVGDSLPPALAPALEAWVREGGVLLADANAGRFDEYHRPTPAFLNLFGLDVRRTEEHETFFRPRQELPFLKPQATVAGPGWEMPALATEEHIVPAKDVEVLAKFKDDDGAAVTERRLGKGRIFYAAALPGVAYLWSALQPPAVPDRGPTAHSVPTAFDAGARALLQMVLKEASVEPSIVAEPALIDARLLKAPKGYILPVANYQDKVGGKVTLTVAVGEPIKKVTSAYQGELPVKQEKGRVVIELPALGYGDLIRLDP